ncbi:egg cell-secreted protein 1.1-like [Senna tora]|uniref:Egg cell-secreted protein 1.1-like n=1 Tax=Senna tora TaxID=362788 RepID=A0A835C8R0_9FABA|nr:egg cell-secreted protein 1.1-like [Senna tora]
MASTSTNYNSLCILLIALIIITASCAPSTTTARPVLSTSSSLAARLKLAEGGTEPSKCWESLFELQACSGEVIMFFLNGETTYLGAGCCQAIRVIGHECWPNIIGTLGFTSEEGDILQGYCDHEHGDDSPHLPPFLEPKKELEP